MCKSIQFLDFLKAWLLRQRWIEGPLRRKNRVIQLLKTLINLLSKDFLKYSTKSKSGQFVVLLHWLGHFTLSPVRAKLINQNPQRNLSKLGVLRNLLWSKNKWMILGPINSLILASSKLVIKVWEKACYGCNFRLEPSMLTNRYFILQCIEKGLLKRSLI